MNGGEWRWEDAGRLRGTEGKYILLSPATSCLGATECRAPGQRRRCFVVHHLHTHLPTETHSPLPNLSPTAITTRVRARGGTIHRLPADGDGGGTHSLPTPTGGHGRLELSLHTQSKFTIALRSSPHYHAGPLRGASLAPNPREALARSSSYLLRKLTPLYLVTRTRSPSAEHPSETLAAHYVSLPEIPPTQRSSMRYVDHRSSRVLRPK